MKILDIKICTSNLKATEDFYNRKLGLPIIFRQKKSISFQAGDTTITFIEKYINAVYHFAFNIPNNQIHEALDWVRTRTRIILNPDGKEIADFDNWDARAFYFFDNNGNILEFLARYQLNNQSDRNFNSSSILSVSEIAIVTDNVNVLAEQLKTDYGIPYFSKQPPHDNFTVMGNDEGLLILSLTDRHWYPTEISSARFPVWVSFSEDKKIHNLSFNT